jgi:23S rRNA (uracil1939-C5)-methyltransferase
MSRLCAHFGTCGGCSFQNMPPSAYAALKREQVVRALGRHGFDNIPVEMPAEVPPRLRRRATLAIAMRDGAAEIGFRAARSHEIVDLRECLVLLPSLVALARSFRELMPSLLRRGQEGELRLTQCKNGFDLALQIPDQINPALSRTFADWVRRKDVARLVINGDVLVQLTEPLILLNEVEVALPPNSFLQPTHEGEQILQDAVSGALPGASRVVDLFAGCGTFTFGLARRRRVHAVDSDAAALEALKTAARKAQKLKPVTVETRDLFSQPLQPLELKSFDAAVVNPPRAGASAQAKAIAKSVLERVVYVSCNPESFARDARIMSQGGFRIAWARPVDQFLWSSHIELVALLERL